MRTSADVRERAAGQKLPAASQNHGHRTATEAGGCCQARQCRRRWRQRPWATSAGAGQGLARGWSGCVYDSDASRQASARIGAIPLNPLAPTDRRLSRFTGRVAATARPPSIGSQA